MTILQKIRNLFGYTTENSISLPAPEISEVEDNNCSQEFCKCLSVSEEEVINSEFEQQIQQLIKSRKVRRSSYVSKDFEKIVDAANNLEVLYNEGEMEVFKESLYKLSARIYLLLNN